MCVRIDALYARMRKLTNREDIPSIDAQLAPFVFCNHEAELGLLRGPRVGAVVVGR